MVDNKQKIRDLMEHIQTITLLLTPCHLQKIRDIYFECCEEWGEELETYLEGLSLVEEESDDKA